MLGSLPENTHRICTGVAGSNCWLAADTSQGYREISQLFADFRLEQPPIPSSGIILSFGDGALPRLCIIDQGRTCGFEEILKRPEWKRFTRIPHPSRRLYADSVLGKGAVIEDLEDELVVLCADAWPLYLQLVWIWLLLRPQSLLSLHAATAALDGEAIVLVGSSGSGKSTLLWALHQQGADCYGDEWAFFRLPEKHLYAYPDSVCLRPGGVDVLETPPVSPSWYEAKPDDPKCSVALPEPSQPCPPDRIGFYFMDGFADTPALAPIRSAEASRRLLKGIGYGDPSVFARLEVAADLVNLYPCWRLSIGKPAETAALLAEHVRRQA